MEDMGMRPKIVVQLPGTLPSRESEPRPPTPEYPTGPVDRGVQTKYRESSAQTHPWQPDAEVSEKCADVPEVVYLDKLEWGPGAEFRTGDLPADFHTTEIINKMRHARLWQETLKKRPAHCTVGREGVIEALETHDWLFREAEIDELQDIRMQLMGQLMKELGARRNADVRGRLDRLWARKRQHMEVKMRNITLKKNRELRKLASAREVGTKAAQAAAKRRARGAGDALAAHADHASRLYAPLARDGVHARAAHADIVVGVELPDFEDALHASILPAWTMRGSNLQRTLSGHRPRRDPRQLCERETRWTEEFLQRLHADLKNTRLNTGRALGPCRLLQLRRAPATPRPQTPCAAGVPALEERRHQAALALQRLVRGRAVQCLMYEGRCKARELISELKSSFGLDEADRARVAALADGARRQIAQHDRKEATEKAIDSMVEELQGGTLSTALDFLEKELRRLKDERKQHAHVLIALRHKTMREAAEAGRRQMEEKRREEHDDLFKKVMGLTSKTVEAYLTDALEDGMECSATDQATDRVCAEADTVEKISREFDESSHPLGSYELVSQLVHHVALPAAHRDALQHGRTGQISADSELSLRRAREQIFGYTDRMVDRTKDEPAVPGSEVRRACGRCGRVCRGRDMRQEGGVCVCWPSCPVDTVAKNRGDPRWRKIMRPADKPVKDASERYPIDHEMRCMLDEMVAEAVDASRSRQAELLHLTRSLKNMQMTKLELALDTKQGVRDAVERAMGGGKDKARTRDYHHFMMTVKRDVLERPESKLVKTCLCLMPSEVRALEEARTPREVGPCECNDEKLAQMESLLKLNEGGALLPSQIRALEELKTCKCDIGTTESLVSDEGTSEAVTDSVDKLGKSSGPDLEGLEGTRPMAPANSVATLPPENKS